MTANQSLPLTLAILAGGASRRLGQDKGLLRPLGDESLVGRAIRLLGNGAPGVAVAEILVVVGHDAQAQAYADALATEGHLNVRVVSDAESWATGTGDLPQSAARGLATALAAARSPWILALPVDGVGVRPFHVEALAAAARESGGRSPITFVDQPMPALWPRALAGAVTEHFRSGDLSLRSALRACGVLEQWTDSDGLIAANLNTADAVSEHFGEPLFDRRGRRLHYLRLSLTQACNMACTYCLPKGFPEWYRHRARLGLPEIETLLKGFRQLGFRKVRLTGGEPTVHPQCLAAVRLARDLGYENVALTTNGIRIGDVRAWRNAGLTHLNISLDCLDADLFRDLTGSREVGRVTAVVDDAVAAGVQVKINTVLMRSKNGQPQHVEALLDYALARPVDLRFIELMDTGLNRGFAAAERVLSTELMDRLTSRGLTPEGQQGASAPPMAPYLGGPATYFRAPSETGEWVDRGFHPRARVGLISPLSCNFCDACNRLRVTAEGRLKLCLFGDHDHPLDLTDARAVATGVRGLMSDKPLAHRLSDGHVGNVATFRVIGG